MRNDIDPRNTQDRNSAQPMFSGADQTPRREGGDDSLAETNPTDSRADEKVIVNEQVSNKTVNAPSQTAVNTSEGADTVDETI